ncbi:ras GTPase-activating protein-binding protein [Fragilaria crotonensis]|nr:ras GTPase-activating protein-binding protein [Fragilaria crotonensis]
MSSPSPPVISATPLTIGRSFVKQYYHVLTTTPDMIYKFYRPSSVLSHGEGSNPTVPATLESLGPNPATNQDLKERFFSWAESSGDTVRFELENGAIDAQESVNGGVLLLVTGHMYVGEARKPFCHTFFLNSVSVDNSNKRQYYVHNDVLRFLQEDTPLKETETVVTDPVLEDEKVAVPAADEEPVIEEEPVKEEESEVVEQEASDAVEPEPELVPEPVVEPILPEEYMEGVEETKDDAVDDIDGVTVAPPVPAADEPVAVEKSVVQAEPVAKPKPPPGSWASLVASGRGNGATEHVKAAPVKKHVPAVVKKEKVTPAEEHPAKKELKEAKKGSEHTAAKPADTSKPRGRRDPDCTLVIKNVQDGVKEADVRLVFEPFAVQTKSNIVGITVSQRGLAFVDYDSAAPVLAALEKRDTFSLNGKPVSIDQKTNDSKNKGRGGGNTNPNRPNGQRSGRSDGTGNRNNSSATNSTAAARKDTGRKESNAGAKGGSSAGGR